jgi:hypothetical protein
MNQSEVLSSRFIDLLKQNQDKLVSEESISAFLSQVMPTLEQSLLDQEKPTDLFVGLPEKNPVFSELPKQKTMNFNPFAGTDLNTNARFIRT